MKLIMSFLYRCQNCQELYRSETPLLNHKHNCTKIDTKNRGQSGTFKEIRRGSSDYIQDLTLTLKLNLDNPLRGI